MSEFCNKCRFHNEKDIKFGTGNTESGIAVVIDTADDTENYKFVTEIFNKKTFSVGSYFVTKAFKCPAGTRSIQKKDLVLCSRVIKEELDIIKPKYVLLIGKVSVQTVLGQLNNSSVKSSSSFKIADVRGKYIQQDGVLYMPTLSNNEKDFSRILFESDVEKLIDFATGKKKIKPVKYKVIEKESDFKEILDISLQTKKLAVDVETNMFSPFFKNSEILSISFSPEECTSFVLPFSWPNEEYFKMWNYTPKINILNAIVWMKDIFNNATIKKIFHNAQFDMVWLEHILNCDINNYTCTMLMQYLIDTDAPKKLKGLAYNYTDMGNWEFGIHQYKAEKDPFTFIPPEKLFMYNAGDTDATIRLEPILFKQVVEKNVDVLLDKFILKKMTGLKRFVKAGVAIDYKECFNIREKYLKDIKEFEADLVEIPEVAELERLTGKKFNPNSSDQRMLIVYGGETSVIEKMSIGNYKNGKPKFKNIKKKIEIKGFGLKSINKFDKVKKKEAQSLDKVAIKKIIKKYYKGIKYQGDIETFNLDGLMPAKHPIINFLNPLCKVTMRVTQLSNHINPFIDYWSKSEDKRVHTNYNMAVARTGRLCIAKGTMIEIVRDVSIYPKGVPIEDVKVGDLAYSYDDTGKLHLKLVKWAGHTGRKLCLKIIWKGQGNHTEGELILSFNHEVRLIDGSWKRADDLVKNDRIMALSRTKKLMSNNNHRVVAVKMVGYQDVYDLEIEDTHCFIANELAVHNSSSAPNLQNISRVGNVKKVFVSRFGDEGVLIEADYKQLELYILGILSGDPVLVHAFTNNIDLHLKVASDIVYKCKPEDVTEEMRTAAKKISFGIIYGKGAKTLADDLNVSEQEAQRCLDEWFGVHAGAKKWMDKVINQYRHNGYVETLTGRRRYISDNGPEGARKAVNTPIQGTASDVCLEASDRLGEEFAPINDKVIPFGTVHDSVWIDSKKDIATDVAKMTKIIMENTGFSWISIPLKVDIKYGPNLKNMIDWNGVDEFNFNHEIFKKEV